MQKSFLLTLCCFVLSYCCFSQNSECISKYNTAMDYYNKGEYATALVYFKQVKENCDEYRGVSFKIKECEDKLKEGNKPGLTVGKSKVSFDPAGGTETIKVNSGEVQWSYGKAPEWLKLSRSKGRLVIECEGNATGEERSADITLYSGDGSNKASKKIHVTQSESVLSVSATSLSFPESGGATYKIEVHSNDIWHVASQSDNWFNVTKTDEGVSVSCDENPYVMERRGMFSVVTSNNESVAIAITQDPSRAFFEMTETSIKATSNAGYYKIRINTNIPDWNAKVEGGSWCMAEKKNDQELLLTVNANDSGYSRNAIIVLSAMNSDLIKEIIVTQKSFGYGALYEDYFDNRGGTLKTTPVSASVYGGGSWGLRVSGYMVRWKVVEVDLLNLNLSFSKSFLLSWEPMVRGYLPLQSDGLAWTPYIGVGRCVPFVDIPLKEGVKVEHSKVLLEPGAEFNLRLKNNQTASGRVFIRIDGTFSVGAAFGLHKWKTKL